MEYEFQRAGTTHRIEIDSEGGCYRVNFGDGFVDVDVRSLSENCLSLIIGGRSYTVFIAKNEEKTYVHVGGHNLCLEEVEPPGQAGFARGGGAVTGEQSVSAPMPGTVVAIQVKEGDEVERNQSLVIVESMKMENALRSPISGRVKRINFKDGDLVDAAAPIVELVPLEETG